MIRVMIKFILKILSLPILLILGVLNVLANFATNIYSYVAGFVINVLIILGIFALVAKNMTGVGISGACLVAVVALTFIIGFCGTFIEMAMESVIDFIFD